MRSQPTADATTAQDALRFRAPTLDEAVAVAEQSLGGKVKVVEANKIRRGGIGGFFASDLGVEVTVVPENETIDEALERLVAESDADERGRWTTRSPRLDAADLTADDEIMDDDMVVDIPAPEMSMKALRKMVDLSTLTPAAIDEQFAPVVEPAPRASRRLQPPAEMVSAQDIIAELRSLTTDPEVSFDRVQDIADRLTARGAALDTARDAAAEAPTQKLASPARKRLGSPAAAKFAEAAAIVTTEQAAVVSAPVVAAPVAAPVVVAPVVEAVAAPVVEVVAAPAVEVVDVVEVVEPPIVMMPVAAPVPAPVAPQMPIIETRTEIVPAAAVDVLPAVRPMRPAGAPSRRHVELTLAAADQLIDSLSRSGNVQRLSVRVVLRSGDHREVEAEAQWESASAPAATTATTDILQANSTEAA